ncbi:MAG TPA: acyl-CoA synthetase [Acidimicrobiia bacterium]|nr:acyl-CoA synthetase [Acidimicrobiia bacterium]
MEPELIGRARRNLAGVALIDGNGSHTFEELLAASHAVAGGLIGDSTDLREERVAFMVPPSFEYVAVQWGIWSAGAVAVPLSLTHPSPELAYVLDDARPAAVIGSPAYDHLLEPLASQRGIRYLQPPLPAGATPDLPKVAASQRAMMLYTSGTTGRPKGVVTTHQNLVAQIRSLVEAWEWTSSDRILLNLPLHHVHGIVNVLACSLWSGAMCEMQPRFQAGPTWDRLASGDLTLYMAVPTIYHRLIEAWDQATPKERERMSKGCRQLRVMVSGSAALPVAVLERWRQISGHTLLERYGMTEIGMGLSNPLHGQRFPGRVGRSLPGIEIRLVNEFGAPVSGGEPGEIQVRGDTIFLEYWQRPEATAAAFTTDGWFRTGDVAIEEDGVFQILGRESVDIIKSGGEKLSALEVEDVLLAHPQVRECAVVGIEDHSWGQRVAAVVVAQEGIAPSAQDLGSWCRQQLANYKVPKEFHLVEALPRNAMGKVNKASLIEQLMGAK